MNISEIAQVNVSLQTATLSRAGFGTILILGNSTVIQGTKQVQTLTFDADLVTANSFTMTVDGVSIGAVPFNTDNNTTLDDIATAIAGQTNVFRAVRTNARTIEITSDSYEEIVLAGAIVTGGATQAGAVIAETVEQRDEIKRYTSLEGVAEDFGTGTIEYQKANAAFSQTPRIQELKIGRRRSPQAQVINVDVTTVTDDTDYTVVLNGETATFNSGFGTTATTISLGLVAAVNALNEPVTLTNNGTDFDIAADIPGESIILTATANLTVTTTTSNKGMADDILRAKQTDNNWYFLLINTELDLDLKEAAKTIQTMEKLFFCQTSAASVKNNAVGNIAAVLKGKSYTRTILSFTDDTTENRDATYAAAGATSDPGSITWVYKKEAGVTAPVLTAGQEANLTALNVNYQVVVKGITFSFTGKVIGGEYIDVMRGIDFFTIRLQEDYLEAQLNSPKIPYTQAGIDTVSQIISTRAEQCIGQGIFASFTVTLPSYSQTTASERGNRTITAKFSGVLQGAIHKLIVNANITN